MDCLCCGKPFGLWEVPGRVVGEEGGLWVLVGRVWVGEVMGCGL